MTALARQHQKIFAIDATQSQVTAFRTTEDEEPIFSKTPDIIQTTNFTSGWLNEDNTGNISPFVEDVNGLFLTLSYNTAYLLEKGVPEYSATQTYYTNSFCQYEGNLYRCKADDTVGFVPTNTEKWDYLHTESYATSSIGTGEAVVATPSGNTFQFKSLVPGNNVTMSSTDDSITINASMNGYANFTANSPLTYSNGVLSLSQASSSANGYLSSADWTSFNSKLSSTIFSANNSWTGTNTFSAITLGANDLATTLSGKQDTISVSSPLSLSSNAISISQANSTTNGYLSSTDWTTFNNKQNAINANNKLSASYISGLGSCATLGYDNSSIKKNSSNQLYVNGKQAQLNGTGFVKANGTTISYDNSTYLKTSGGAMSGGFSTTYIQVTSYIQNDGPYYFGLGTSQYITKDSSNNVVIRAGSSNRDYIFGPASGGNVSGSDAKIKKNVKSMSNGILDIINQLRPVKFDFIEEDSNNSIRAGFIAQEVDLIPELYSVVYYPTDLEVTDNYGIDYAGFVPYLVKAIQELSAKVTVLENKLEAINGN